MLRVALLEEGLWPELPAPQKGHPSRLLQKIRVSARDLQSAGHNIESVCFVIRRILAFPRIFTSLRRHQLRLWSPLSSQQVQGGRPLPLC